MTLTLDLSTKVKEGKRYHVFCPECKWSWDFTSTGWKPADEITCPNCKHVSGSYHHNEINEQVYPPDGKHDCQEIREEEARKRLPMEATHILDTPMIFKKVLAALSDLEIAELVVYIDGGGDVYEDFSRAIEEHRPALFHEIYGTPPEEK